MPLHVPWTSLSRLISARKVSKLGKCSPWVQIFWLDFVWFLQSCFVSLYPPPHFPPVSTAMLVEDKQKEVVPLRRSRTLFADCRNPSSWTLLSGDMGDEDDSSSRVQLRVDSRINCSIGTYIGSSASHQISHTCGLDLRTGLDELCVEVLG